MTSLQKAIKYLAMAFAVFLIVTIIGGIIAGLAGVSLLFSDRDEDSIGEMQMYAINEDITSLSLSLGRARLQIKTADSFSVESNHKYISVKSEDGLLCITETGKRFSVYPEGLTVILMKPWQR